MAVLSETDPQQLLVASIGPACHELRSPLAVVYGFAKMLDSQGSLDETQQKYVTQIVNGAHRMDVLLDSLSKIGRIAAGRLQPTPEAVPLRGIVDALAATTTNVGRVSVDTGADVQVKADPDWLSEAFQGIIDALCFEEATDLRISWTHEADEVHVRFMPHSSFPMVDTEPEKSSLALGLARMRIVAMGGAVEGLPDRVAVTLTRA